MSWLEDWKFCRRADCTNRVNAPSRQDLFFLHQELIRARNDDFKIKAMRYLLFQEHFDPHRMSDESVIDQISELMVSGRIHVHVQPVETSATFGNFPSRVSELGEVEAAIRLMLRSPRSNATKLVPLLYRAIDLLDFSIKEKNKGLLFSGELPETNMYEAAKDYAKARDKVPVFSTDGGKWLDQWTTLEDSVGKKEYDEIWKYASVKYVKVLEGRVVVILANAKWPDYSNPDDKKWESGIFRSAEGVELYKNTRVTQIFYRIEHKVHGVGKPIIGPKIVKGKQVLFIFGDYEP
jgi:hypothetical protein